MKLYNYQLKTFIEFLLSLSLIDQKSRMRTRLTNLLNDKLNQFKEEHIQLLKEHCHLDENDMPKILEVEGEQQFDVIDIEAFSKAYSDLENEEVFIEQNCERRNMLLSVKDSVLNCGMEFSGESAMRYDAVCQIVEQIQYEEEI